MAELGSTYLFATPLLILLLTIATFDDFIEHRIPNVVVVWGIVLALGIGGLTGGHAGFLTAMGGLIVGGLLLLPFHVLGGMGAGDVKLMAMVGAFLGPSATIFAVAVTLAAGLVLALSVLGLWLVMKTSFGLATLKTLRQYLPVHLRPSYPGERPGHFPYAAAIAVGAMVATWWPVTAASLSMGG